MLDLPPTHCESKQAFAEIVMTHVNSADLSKIAAAYKAYGKDRHRRVLRKALTNYAQEKPLTPTEFGLKMYEECINE